MINKKKNILSNKNIKSRIIQKLSISHIDLSKFISDQYSLFSCFCNCKYLQKSEFKTSLAWYDSSRPFCLGVVDSHLLHLLQNIINVHINKFIWVDIMSHNVIPIFIVFSVHIYSKVVDKKGGTSSYIWLSNINSIILVN